MPSLRPRRMSHDPAGRRNPARLVVPVTAWSIGSTARGIVAGTVICTSARRLTPLVTSGLDSMLPPQLVGVTAWSTCKAGLLVWVASQTAVKMEACW
jgi:hypothetical protein